MTPYLLIGFLLFSIGAKQAATLDDLRAKYRTATTNATVCKQQLSKVKAIRTPDPLQQAYIGAYFAVWAKHADAPLTKLNSFKRGKKDLEEAVRRDKDNPEIRFLRLTIQYHAPRMLRYKDNIRADCAFIIKHYQQISPLQLKDNIKAFLLSTDVLTKEQRKTL